ncbi:MAG: autotransporter assembly complex family protein [Thermodesulfobacteriota bacterium]|jgi:translocation and assembly module TamA|nr:autotransporter assembly complex family protein [Thermodesulfobacteriota bacterium]
MPDFFGCRRLREALLRGLIIALLATAFLPLAGLSAHAQTKIEVLIEGIMGDALANVEQALELPRGLVHDGRINKLWLRRFERQIPEKAARALEPFGCYQPVVEVEREEFDRNSVRLRVKVDPGPVVRIEGRRLLIEGDAPRILRRRLDSFPLSPGGRLLHVPYEKAKGELLGVALDLGFLDARYTRHVIRVNPQENSAVVELTLKPGPRYRFGEISIEGAPDYPERFLRRYVTARPGDIFSYDSLSNTQRNFLDSDRFRNVIVKPHKDAAKEYRVPVDIQLAPSPRRRLRPGIGYGTDTGARVSLRYQDVNLWHKGHKLELDTLLAELRQSGTATYILPGYRNLDTMFALRGGYQREDFDPYETEFLFAEAERIVGHGQGRQSSVYLRYQLEKSTVGGESVDSGFLMPGLRYSQVRFDNQVRPEKGYRYRFEARGTYSGLLSDITLGQVLGEGNLLVRLPMRNFIHLRMQFGATLQKDPVEDIPASLRFFAGGDHSVRGYAYQTLGPRNDEGEVVGGKHLLVGSVELEHRFSGNWAMAAFFDIGNAFNRFTYIKAARSAGTGVRYYTPVGPVRLDLARQLGEDDPSWRLHVGIGFGW